MNWVLGREGGLAVARGPRGAGIRLGVAVLIGVAFGGRAAVAGAPVGSAGAETGSAYAIGYRFGGHLAGLRGQGREIDLEAVLRGVLDGLSGTGAAQPPSAPAGSGAPSPGGKRAERSAVPSRARGYVDDYAALNARRPGVVVLPSGLQYEVLEAGEGRRPGPQDTVVVSYRGLLADGVAFDGTDPDEPARLRVDQIVIPGLKEAILLMHEGDRWRVTIPAALGFSGRRMLRKRDLIYEIELLAVQGPPEAG